MEKNDRTRSTAQRRLIMELMRDNYSHPTADEVYDLARERDSRISRGTVYRNLNFLAQTGDIRKITMPRGADYFDNTTKNHYHFYCRVCKRVFDVPVAYNEALNATPDGMGGFAVEWHRILFAGLCPQCNNKNAGGIQSD